MDRFEQLRDKVRMGNSEFVDLRRSVTVKTLFRWMEEIEAAEVKERPDSEGWWWAKTDSIERFYVRLNKDGKVSNVAPDAKALWVKVEPPTFPEPSNDLQQRDNDLAAERDRKEPAAQEIREWCMSTKLQEQGDSEFDDGLRCAYGKVVVLIDNWPPEPEVSDEPPPTLTYGRFSACKPDWHLAYHVARCELDFELLPNEHQDMEQARKWLEEARK